MTILSRKLRTAQGGLRFWCPACKTTHGVSLGREGWQWNENEDKPTFNPSLYSVTGDLKCHCFVRDGKIEYLSGSTHELKGQTIELPDWPFKTD